MNYSTAIAASVLFVVLVGLAHSVVDDRNKKVACLNKNGVYVSPYCLDKGVLK